MARVGVEMGVRMGALARTVAAAKGHSIRQEVRGNVKTITEAVESGLGWEGGETGQLGGGGKEGKSGPPPHGAALACSAPPA